MLRLTSLLLTSSLATIALHSNAMAAAPEEQCAAFAKASIAFADPSTHIVSASFHPDGEQVKGAPPSPDVTLPAHCELVGVSQERKGLNGQSYAIRFRMRLPAAWNARFLFQGGGGSNGDIGLALGQVSTTGPVAAAMGYAVVSQDSGHANGVNSDPAHNGDLAFGFDPTARANYGHRSLKVVADAAKAIIRAYYGKAPAYSYFVGCSKGGQEGMAFAQRYPSEFDGIIAAAPGFSLPRAALAEAWDVQTFGKLVQQPGAGGYHFFDLTRAYSPGDLDLVRGAILSACDKDDGVVDGMVLDVLACTDAKVVPALQSVVCTDAKTKACLSQPQIAALIRAVHGPKDSTGKALYADWFWPTGLAGEDWRLWKLGSSDGHIPALNVILGGASLASVFTTPPTALGLDPQTILQYQASFDFDKDAKGIYAVAAPFKTSAWQDVGSRSADLSAFRARKGRLIVPQGDSDPVFSLRDTLNWFGEVDARSGGHAADFVRVFPVPGMCHCAGGQATEAYDAFSALTAWVETGAAPGQILATASPRSPWPGRTRPLCAYPQVARYKGQGDIEQAANFECRL